ncbi:hypothetical protein LY90DRAFT_508221 [Neocallimastix californiae]|uniref:Uncharacterized protein n=1 Tax=Neocallimastix californiae TaxID=1754190 RepID=A0A1Y2CYX6_9FUNG|nr:hypothetical protein LY90DRAFT_508221 [Neocallimastix californiae]|eukprot:ORY52241.1 hypothetical protein LY90DRAFT_508221 [Neocallimastix californiae]
MTANAGRIPKQYVHNTAKTEKSIRTENYTKNDLIKPTTNSSFPVSLTKPRTFNTNNALTVNEKKKLETYDSSKIKPYNNYKVENITTISNKNKNLYNINDKCNNNNNTYIYIIVSFCILL